MRKLVLALSMSIVALAAVLLLSNSGDVLAWADEPTTTNTSVASGFGPKTDVADSEWVETAKHHPKPKHKKSSHHP